MEESRNVGLQDDMVENTFLDYSLILGRQELIEHAVEAGEFADFSSEIRLMLSRPLVTASSPRRSRW